MLPARPGSAPSAIAAIRGADALMPALAALAEAGGPPTSSRASRQPSQISGARDVGDRQAVGPARHHRDRMGPQGVRAAHHARQRPRGATPLAAQQSPGTGRALAWPTTVGAEIAMLLPDPSRCAEETRPVQPTPRPRIRWRSRMRTARARANQRAARATACWWGVACRCRRQAARAAGAARRPSRRCCAADRLPRWTSVAQTDREIARLFDRLRRGPARDSAALLVTGEYGFALGPALAPNGAGAGRPAHARAGSPTNARWWRSRSNDGGASSTRRRRDACSRAASRAGGGAGRSFRRSRQTSCCAVVPIPTPGVPSRRSRGSSTTPRRVLPSARKTGAPAVTSSRRDGYGFVAWGRGPRSQVRIPRMRQTDVPTAARLLGIELGEVSGRPPLAFDLPPAETGALR